MCDTISHFWFYLLPALNEIPGFDFISIMIKMWMKSWHMRTSTVQKMWLSFYEMTYKFKACIHLFQSAIFGPKNDQKILWQKCSHLFSLLSLPFLVHLKENKKNFDFKTKNAQIRFLALFFKKKKISLKKYLPNRIFCCRIDRIDR